jgi:hypothetical protein
MSKALFILALAAVAISGCKKNEPAAEAPPAEKKSGGVSIAEAAPEGQPAPTPTTTAPAETPAAPPAEADPGSVSPEPMDVNISRLQSVVDSYYAENKRVPTFEILLAGKYLNGLPTPPAGKKYVIDAKSITVKSVNK